ncbi:bifunctional diguanylate cyclase/phosphodiesterase [Pelagibacterium halotolerans]|uniref:Diguanylate cyclase/phosphodiesterase (GGDEF & EAL domains) with PAS/PAC sensor(S) n=1 Tax=Pelagibacterium halotolerans (strain DSM 22347 / JCM 15775 / CGMCC 1.7692 / B2) TaxID=1082931 RepID=G4RFT6_PELHB|nr:diguanylate cyclase/phosphodiesterase (GGDEF & EAL domains) with PAS/PAC sensor(s) [Pelagibacterium halotolerans B2]SEA47945.1 PAS domain S-box-containing protein/diguanylate cyclase (GGDEF) domain-containing protein [Pelagibacterium halotolerans]
MGEVFSTLYHQHDLRLVVLAAFICALSSFAGVSILAHARRSAGAMRTTWLAIAAVSVGFGIWATHFVAMLSFDVGFPAGYDVGLTLASLLIAIAVCGTGFAVAGLSRRRSDLVLGGAIVGLGISAMHYTGMQALRIGGEVSWDSGLVAGSIITGIVFGAAALRVGASGHGRARIIGAGILTLAICSMHFTAMGAAGFANCYAIAAPGEITPGVLSLVVGAVSILILLAALGSLYLDVRDRRRAAVEESRMRGLADAAVEGLVVCSDRTIVAVNAAFQRLAGEQGKDVSGRAIAEFLAPTGCIAVFERANELVETELTALNGERIPVEVVMREVDFGGSLHRAIAVRDLRARKQAEHHIRFLAHHDAMTGLANRASFNTRLEDEIARARLARQNLAVLCLDLDRFKEVNDLFGHAAGDALLQRVAGLIERNLTGGQFAGRLGGDEFAVILPNVISAAHASALAANMLEVFAQANNDDGEDTVISASIGIALYPEHAQDADQLMTYADTALYCAKAEGRGTYRVFESQMGAQVRDRRLLEHDLRSALVSRQLSLVYQPQVDLETGEVSGFEALVRWNHPERGAVPPSTFIPIAEETGLILQLGEWVMRTACTQAAGWTAPLMIAVNVSAVQLHAPNFVAFVEKLLVETGLAAERLEIEITETAMIRNMNRALANLRQIKALGIRVAMDDFGTGYSSLSNLRAFPFDRIKVDQSFIRSVHDNDQSAAIVRAVLGLGKGLNLPILAEGVERLEELDFLKDEICDAAQGYWFSRPEDISAFEDVVRGTSKTLSGQKVVPLKRRA